MVNRRLLAAAFVFFIQADILALAQTVCENNNGNYTSSSAYSANLNATLSSLSTDIGNDGFYNASTGQGTDRVNAVAMCRGDLQLDRCRDCVKVAGADLVQSCPNQKQAVRWDDSCTLRYSNASIYGVRAIGPIYYLSNTNVTSPEQFRTDLRELLDDLRRKAAAGGGSGVAPRKVAAGNATGPDFQTIFGLVQCTPDLSSEDCTICLVDAISRIPQCCDGKKGGRVISPSCNIRFETYLFFNETRLQELEFVPHPPPPPPSPQPSPPAPEKKSSSTTRTIIIIVALVVGCLILAVSAIIFLRKRNKQKPIEISQSVDEISTAESLQYAFSTIKAATNDFSDHNKLGQGGFGTVYKGKLLNGQEIAVKRLSRDSGQGDLEFKNEVLLLAKLQHRNLVRLLGFAIEGVEKLLVYEFVQNASLDHFIFVSANRSNLDWDRRSKIIGGIARGILYLHEDSRLRIIHRDLKASNILLDGEMSPKIADFGMARLFRQDETQGNTSRVVGTYGYMPPEYLMHGQFSIKSDVFSFGVLVLEIISGQKNNAFRSGERVEDLVSFAWKSWKEGRGADVVDPFLRSGLGSMNEMLRCIHIGLLCVQEDTADRPTMASVVLMLSSFSISLDLPSEPAFYASDASFTQQVSNISTNSDHSKSPPGPVQAHHQSQTSSQNDSSITELQPR